MSDWTRFLEPGIAATPLTVAADHNPAPDASPAAQPMVAQNACLLEAPSAQATINLIPSWTSKLPENLGVVSGYANLFDDSRASWAIEGLGGVVGKSALELGPLEGGHTYMLEKAGAREVIAIEANKLSFMKCLIVKEICGLKRSTFLLGDFTQWLDQNSRPFDVAWVAGVLYHMDDPTRLLQQISKHTDSIYLWTHYVPDEPFGDDGLWTTTLVRVEERTVRGRVVPHYIKSYLEMGKDSSYCGGVYTTASWLRKKDIFEELRLLGFAHTEVAMDVRHHQNGPCISILGSKKPLPRMP
jgi:SAM-dependent methyltransferase